VAGTSLFLTGQTLQVLLIVGFDILLGQADAAHQAVDVEDNIFHVGRFNASETFGIGFVKSLKILVIDLDFAHEILGRKFLNLYFTALQVSLQGSVRLLGHRQCRSLKRNHHLATGEVLTNTRFKPLGRHALAGSKLAVTFHVQLAIGTTKPGDRRTLLKLTRQPCITGHQKLFLSRRRKHALVDHLLQGRHACRNGVQHLGIHVRHLRADAIHLTLVRIVPLLLRDRLTVYLGHSSRLVGEAAVALYAKHDERRYDQQEQQPHHDLGVVADGIEHDCLSMKKKANKLVRLSGGGGC